MSGMLKDWSADHTARFQKEIITFKHALNETGLFTDEALADLLNKHPKSQLDVCTMGDPNHPVYPNRLRTGDFREVDGKILIQAAKAGAIWINVRKAMNLHPEYKVVLDEMYGGIAQETGNKIYNAKLKLFYGMYAAKNGCIYILKQKSSFLIRPMRQRY